MGYICYNFAIAEALTPTFFSMVCNWCRCCCNNLFVYCFCFLEPSNFSGCFIHSLDFYQKTSQKFIQEIYRSKNFSRSNCWNERQNNKNQWEWRKKILVKIKGDVWRAYPDETEKEKLEVDDEVLITKRSGGILFM